MYSDDMYCYDALYMAVDNGNAELVKLFLSLGANANVAYNEDGLCPLVMSCSMNSYPVTCLLLQYGAKTKVKDRSGMSPLSIARRHKNDEMIKLLEKSR